MPTDYSNMPNNSNKAKEEAKKREPLVNSKDVVLSKNKAKSLIFRNTVDDLGSYLLNNVLAPGIINWLHGTLSSIIDAVFANGNGRPGTQNGNYIYKSSVGNFDYSRCSSPITNIKSASQQRNEPTVDASTSTKNYNSYVFKYKEQAESVLSALRDILEQYPYVTINDYFELIDVTGDQTGQNYGWTNLNAATVKPTGIDGWRIDFPRAIVLPH